MTHEFLFNSRNRHLHQNNGLCTASNFVQQAECCETHMQVKSDLHEICLQVAMCDLHADSAIRLVLAARSFDIVLQSLYVCPADHIVGC